MVVVGGSLWDLWRLPRFSLEARSQSCGFWDQSGPMYLMLVRVACACAEYSFPEQVQTWVIQFICGSFHSFPPLFLISIINMKEGACWTGHCWGPRPSISWFYWEISFCTFLLPFLFHCHYSFLFFLLFFLSILKENLEKCFCCATSCHSCRQKEHWCPQRGTLVRHFGDNLWSVWRPGGWRLGSSSKASA
jgi:hypothetical protein